MTSGDEPAGSPGASVSLKPFEAARLSLSRIGLPGTEELTRALTCVAQIGADAMQVARVGVWLCEGDERLRNVFVFDARTRQASAGETFSLDDWPAYREAIRTRRVVAVSDTTSDARTRSLLAHYLVPHGIGATLDAPIYLDGQIVGVLCLEHVGPRRDWTQPDRDFGSSVADVLSTLLQQVRRLQVEEQLRLAREELVRAESRHALARLAAGVAHDLNNLLTIISLNASSLPSGGPAHLIEEQCQVGARLARQLLAFARERPPQVQDLDLPEVIRSVRSLLASALGPACPLELLLPDEPLMVRCDRSEIEQIVLNLAVNARAAMPRGGPFTLEVRGRGDEVLLWATDRGVGIPEEVR
ncbi:MAG: sensor histidine kinase, partial [Myxococcales bacterium]